MCLYKWLHDYLPQRQKSTFFWKNFLTPQASSVPLHPKKRKLFLNIYFIPLNCTFFRILAYYEMACNNSINSRDFIFFQKLIGHLLLLVLGILTSLRGCVRSFTLLDPITGRELQFRVLSPRFWRLYNIRHPSPKYENGF